MGTGFLRSRNSGGGYSCPTPPVLLLTLVLHHTTHSLVLEWKARVQGWKVHRSPLLSKMVLLKVKLKISLCPINIRSNKKQPKIKNRVSTGGVARTLQKLMDLSMQEIRVLLRPRLPSVFCHASLAAGRP